MSAPANTVASTSGRFGCCIAIAMPGLALPAAQPHTEFTTSISVPLVFLTASSTSAAVFSSFAPIAVISPRIGAISISGYGIDTFLLFQHGVTFGLELVARLPLGHPVRVRDAVADGQHQLRVIRGTVQVPVRLHFV